MVICVCHPFVTRFSGYEFTAAPSDWTVILVGGIKMPAIKNHEKKSIEPKTMKAASMTSIPNMLDIAPPGQAAPPRNIRPMRRICGLAMAVTGLNAPLASAAFIIVQNGGLRGPDAAQSK